MHVAWLRSMKVSTWSSQGVLAVAASRTRRKRRAVATATEEGRRYELIRSVGEAPGTRI